MSETPESRTSTAYADGARAEDRGPARRRGGGGTTASALGVRLGVSFLIGAVPAAVVAYLCGALSAGGTSRSVASVTLNTRLLMLSALAIPVIITVVGVLLRWRRIDPVLLTWGFSVTAGLSWLALLFAAQIKGLIPHLPPLVSVPVVVGAGVAAAAYMTDDGTTVTGRYVCLAAVIAAHAGIVAIALTIVLG